RAGDQPLAAVRDIRDVEGVAALTVPALVHDPRGAPAGESKLAHACAGARVVGGAGRPAAHAGDGVLAGHVPDVDLVAARLRAVAPGDVVGDPRAVHRERFDPARRPERLDLRQ